MSHWKLRTAALCVVLTAGCDGSSDLPADAGAASDASRGDSGATRDAGALADAGCDICDAGVDAGPPTADYYVSVDGDDDGPGTLEAPFATLAAADAVAAPGDLVYVRGGVYAETVRIDSAGREGEPIRWEGYPGEEVVFRGLGRGATPWAVQIEIAGGWNELRRVRVEDSTGPGVRVFGDHVWIDDVTVRESGSIGIVFYEADHGAVTHSLVSHSYDQFRYDGSPGDGGNGDGVQFQHSSDGLVSHVISWGNSDDGYDLWGSFRIRIERSYAFGNGVDRWDGEGFDGDGNGFKLGNCDSRGNTSHRNVSWANEARGFDSNCAQETSVSHCVSYDDRYGFHNRHATNPWTNNVGVEAGAAVVQSMEDEARSNAWDLGFEVTQADFRSIAPPALTGDESAAEALALFEASDFLRPTDDGPLVDAGEDLGDAFEGAAPDLGAFEVR